jgi:hypothetical protein
MVGENSIGLAGARSRRRLGARHPQAPEIQSRVEQRRLFLGDLPALIFHFATTETHRALSCEFEILCRSFSFTRDFLIFDSLTLI